MEHHKLNPRSKSPPERHKLTDRFVKTVLPQDKRVLYWDQVQANFALAVEPSGHKAYKLIYTFGNRPRWYHIADARAIGLKEARQIARDKMAEVTSGVDVQTEKLAGRKANTFEELAEKYVEEYAKRRNRSWRQADFLVTKYLIPRWAKRPAADIQRGDVKAVFRAITDSGAPSMANQVLAAAGAIYSWAIKEEALDIPANPCRGIERNPTKSRERVLSNSELPVFWNAFEEAGLARSRALRMILLTGQRPGEIAHMRREDIEDGWWTLQGDPDLENGWPGTKNGQTHRIWLPEPAVAILKELDDEKGGFVFTGPTGRSVVNLNSAMREICVHVGIEKPDKITPHDLRRTHGTTVTGLGYTRDQMNRLQNHKEGGIGSVYDRHSYADEIKRIQEAVAARIMALVEDHDNGNVVPIRQ